MTTNNLTRRAAVVAVLDELRRVLAEEEGNGYNAVADRLGISSIDENTTRRAAVAQFFGDLSAEFTPQGIANVLATLRAA